MIAQQPLTDTDLELLARQRAENLQTAIPASNETLEVRVNIVGVDSVSKESGEMVKMKVTLSTGEPNSNQQGSNPR